ncbi:MAG TPA: MogA/MoaB family molybdenum cofactor biosynthesis protein [Terracidiphilus sp.]|jgi:molybdopterin adenylyltransferase|nr:MogA/MoaB family molybdenum cofactor biosynthesis protein [Terracidiphilus sp.]
MLIGVLTVSDRCSRGEATDTSGPAVVALVLQLWANAIVETGLVADEEEQIIARLQAWTDAHASLILTVGGTGMSPRDRTPEATRRLLEREAPGLAEAMRAKAAQRNSFAWLSRGVAGLIGATLVVNLPGSKRGAEENLASIMPLLHHAIEMIEGGQSHP